MTPIAFRQLALASAILLGLAGCAATPPATAANAVTPVAVDLGPSSHVPATRMTMAGPGQGMYRPPPGNEPDSKVHLVHAGGADAHAVGTVNAVDPARHKINLSHAPVPSLGWPAMTMEFPVARPVDLTRVRPGTRVHFSIQKGRSGQYEVQSVRLAGVAQ